MSEYSINAFPPARFQDQGGPLAGESLHRSITHVETPEGTELIAGLEGQTLEDAPSVSEMDPGLVAALVADLLRSGWDQEARPLTQPVLEEGTIFRGFVLQRSSRLWKTDQEWKLTVLLPARLEEEFDWPAVREHIDRFSEYFMSHA